MGRGASSTRRYMGARKSGGTQAYPDVHFCTEYELPPHVDPANRSTHCSTSSFHLGRCCTRRERVGQHQRQPSGISA